MDNDQSNSGGLNIDGLQGTGLYGVEWICSIVTMPVEMIIRPWYGTRYFPVALSFATTFLMLILPWMAALFASLMQMIPFSRYVPPPGLFGFASMTKLYFLLWLIHGWRLWQRMRHMDREINSLFEGPPLPFFALLPKSDSPWFTRIVLEPCVVFIFVTVLEHLYILQSGLATYLQTAAVMLFIKSWIAWFRSWQILRWNMDIRNSSAALGDLLGDNVTEETLAPQNVASFPENQDPQARQAEIEEKVRLYSARNYNAEQNKEMKNEAH
jgi:hypothetical protein